MRLQRLGGFTLIEVAIVVAIIAVLMTLGLGFLSTQFESNAYGVTKRRAEIIKDALITYLGAEKRFPCPYVPTPDSPAPITGQAPPLGGTPPTCPEAFGVVPFATLGLSREIAEDGWGNMFSYQVHYDPSAACPGEGLNWANQLCFGQGKKGNLRVLDDATEIASSVVAVVISHGPNGLGAYVAQGTRNANPTKCQEAQNAHLGSCDPTPPPNEDYVYYKGLRPNDNDDVVEYLTAHEAIQTLVKQGTIKSAVGQAADDLQAIHDQVLGAKYASVSADPATGCGASLAGSLTHDPWDDLYEVVGTIVRTSRRDPWGKQYVVDDSSAAPTGSPPGLPVCIYSTGSTGAAPDRGANTCSCAFPTICRNIQKSELNRYLLAASLPTCP